MDGGGEEAPLDSKGVNGHDQVERGGAAPGSGGGGPKSDSTTNVGTTSSRLLLAVMDEENDILADVASAGDGKGRGQGDYLDDAETMLGGGRGANGRGGADIFSPSSGRAGPATQFMSFSGSSALEVPMSPANANNGNVKEERATGEHGASEDIDGLRVATVIRMPTVGNTAVDTQVSDMGEDADDSFNNNNARFGVFKSMFGGRPQSREGSSGAQPSVLVNQVKGTVRSMRKFKNMAGRVTSQSRSIQIAETYVTEVGADIYGIKFTRRTQRGQGKGQDDSAIDTKGFPFLIFHPYQPWRLLWDVCVMVLLIWSFISVPIRLAFERQTSSEDCNPWFDKQEPIFYYDLSSDIIFICDMILMFRTAYFDDSKKDGDIATERKIITDWRKIARRYLTGFFIIDLSSSVPLDLILLSVCSGLNGAQKLLRGPSALKIMRLVRVLRLLRVTRLRVFLQKLRDVLHVHPGMLRVIRFFFVVALIMHYNACLFYYIGEADTRIAESDFGVKSWTHEFSFAIPNSTADQGYTYQTPHEMSMSSAYLVSLYWSLTTMTTVGYGDVTPTTLSGLVYSIFVLIQAGVAFSYMVGNMANLLSRVNPRHQRHQEGMEVWEEFMHREKMAPELRQRIRNHKQYLYRYPVIKLPSFARDNMSRTLLRDVTAHLYRSALHSLPMFKGLDEHTLTELALALEPMQIAPKTIIYREGELGDCMYFISNGEVTMSMLLLDAHTKEELGIQIVPDAALSENLVVSGDGKSGEKTTFKHRQTDDLEWIGKNLGAEGTAEGRRQRDLSVFKWIMSHESPNTFFGEGCLTSRSPLRKATAVANTWVTLFRLDKAALQRVADKSPSMKRIYRKMQRTQACKLLRAVRIMIYGRRARYARAGKLIVRVEEGRNMPKMDSFMGLCDAYCTLNVGFPEPEKKTYKTMVQYNKFNPLWRETFIFPINFSLRKLQAGMPVKMHLNVLDYDVLGDHDLIGQAEYEVSQLVKQSLATGLPVTQAVWLSLKRRSEDGKLHTVKGFNRSSTKVRLLFQVQPPDDDSHCRSSMDTQSNPPSAESQFATMSVGAPVPLPHDLMSIAANGPTEKFVDPQEVEDTSGHKLSLDEAEQSYHNDLLRGKAAAPISGYVPPAGYDAAKARDMLLGNNLFQESTAVITFTGDSPPEVTCFERAGRAPNDGNDEDFASESRTQSVEGPSKEYFEFAYHEDDAASNGSGGGGRELPAALVRKVSQAEVPGWGMVHQNEYLQEVAEASGRSAEALENGADGVNSGHVSDVNAFLSFTANKNGLYASMSRSSDFSSFSGTPSTYSRKKNSRDLDEEEEEAAFDATATDLSEKQALQMLLEAAERDRIKNEMELDEMWKRVEKIDDAAMRLQLLQSDVLTMAEKAVGMLQGAGLVPKGAPLPATPIRRASAAGGAGFGGGVDLPGTPVNLE